MSTSTERVRRFRERKRAERAEQAVVSRVSCSGRTAPDRDRPVSRETLPATYSETRETSETPETFRDRILAELELLSREQIRALVVETLQRSPISLRHLAQMAGISLEPRRHDRYADQAASISISICDEEGAINNDHPGETVQDPA